MATGISKTERIVTLFLPLLALALALVVAASGRPRFAVGQEASPILLGAVVTGHYSELQDRRVIGLDDSLHSVDLGIELPDDFSPERVAVSPDGSSVAVNAVRVGGGEYLVAVHDTAGTRVVHRSAGPNSGAGWSPNSDRLFFGHTPPGATAAQIWSTDLRGQSGVVADLALPNARRSRCPLERTVTAYVDGWLADGRLTIAAVEQCPAIHEEMTKELLALDVATGAFELLADEAGAPAVSEDGSTLAYVQEGVVVVRDLASGDESELAAGAAPTFREDGRVAFVQDPRPSDPGRDVVVEADTGGGESEQVAGASALGDLAQVIQAPDALDELIALEAVNDAGRLVRLRADGSAVGIMTDVVAFDIAR